MIKKVLSNSFETTQKNFVRLLLMSLPLLLSLGLSNSLNYDSNNYNWIFALISFIFTIVSIFLTLVTNIGYLVSKRNDSYQFKNLFNIFKHKGFITKVIGIFLILFFMVVTVLIIGLISSVFIGIGIINFFIGSNMGFFPFVGLLISSIIVIGIIVLSIIVSYGLAFLFIKFYDDFLNGEDNLIYAFKNAWNLMKGYKFKLFLVNVISGLIIILLTCIFAFIIYLSSLLMSVVAWLAIAFMVIFIIIFIIILAFWWIWNEMTMITFYEEINSK